MHKICKVRGSNLGHHKKKKQLSKYLILWNILVIALGFFFLLKEMTALGCLIK